MYTSLQIPQSEFDARTEHLLEHVQANGLEGAVIFDSTYILYFTGFAFIPTERPIVFAVNAAGEKAMYVPRLEVEHVRAKTGIERVGSYLEYPYQPHPMEGLAQLLRELGVQGRIGADSDGYPWIFGYRGPALSAVTGAEVCLLNAAIEDLMMIKSSAEIAMIRESVRWAHLAHRLLQRYTRPGVTETEARLRAGHEATLAMVDALEPYYRSQSMYGDGPSAGYRGQIGRNAAVPHSLASNTSFQPGDVLVSGASCPMWGYNSELERTMFLGKPTAEQQRLFEHMCCVQEVAFEAIRPGVPCSEVDRAVRVYYDKHDLMPYWKHHAGHAIGLRYHEAPFLDLGDPTEIKPGMVFTVEPGLYSPEWGGFRHSDTVVVTEAGLEFLTYYPRDLASLTLPL